MMTHQKLFISWRKDFHTQTCLVVTIVTHKPDTGNKPDSFA